MLSGTFLLVCIGLSSFPGSLTYRATFSLDDLSFTTMGSYDYVELVGADAIGCPGSPSLPRFSLVFVIPAGSCIEGVYAEVSSIDSISGTYTIWPAQPPVPMGYEDSTSFVEPDSSIYELDVDWPDTSCQSSDLFWTGGTRLARVDVFPLVWNPDTEKLSLRTAIDLTIVLEEDTLPLPDEVVMTNWRWQRRIEELAEYVVNSDNIGSYSVEPDLVSENTVGIDGAPIAVDCILITNDDWAGSWEPLVDWNNRRGVYTEIVTYDDISDGVDGEVWVEGRDWGETIRNCIRWYYTNLGIQYVILGADSRNYLDPLPPAPADIPSRFCQAYFWNEMEGPMLEIIGTDWYYACLDESFDWNTNGDDEVWGEYHPTDPELNDLMDLTPEVHVGRLPASSAAEARDIAAKLVAYQHHLPEAASPSEDLLVISASVDMGSGYAQTYQHFEEIVSDVPHSIAQYWVAEDKCQYRDVGISPTSVIDCLDGSRASAYRVTFGGHGGADWLAANWEDAYPYGNKVYTDDLRGMEGSDGELCTSWAFNCDTGRYAQLAGSGDDTVAETWLGTDGYVTDAPLGPCYIGNFGRGINAPRAGSSPCHRLNRFFLDALYNCEPGTGTWGAGEPFSLAKCIYHAEYIGTPPVPPIPPAMIMIVAGQWMEPMYGLKNTNLMGDPSAPLWIDVPADLFATYSSTVRCPDDFDLSVQDSQSQPIEGVRVCLLMQRGEAFEVYVRGFTDEQGEFSTYLDPEYGGDMLVTLTKQDFLPHEGEVEILVP